MIGMYFWMHPFSLPYLNFVHKPLLKPHLKPCLGLLDTLHPGLVPQVLKSHQGPRHLVVDLLVDPEQFKSRKRGSPNDEQY